MKSDVLNVETCMGRTNWVDYTVFETEGEGSFWDLEEFVDVPEEEYPELEVALQLGYCNVVAEDDKFVAKVGLSGRSGYDTYNAKFDTFEEAAANAVEYLYKEHLSPSGKHYGVDAMR